MSEPKKIKEIVGEQLFGGKYSKIIYEDGTSMQTDEQIKSSNKGIEVVGFVVRHENQEGKLHREAGAAFIGKDVDGKITYAEWWENGEVIASFAKGKLYKGIDCNPKKEIKVLCTANRYLNHPDYANVVDLPMVKNAVLAFENRINNEDERPGLVQIEFSNVHVNKSENELPKQQQITSDKLNSLFSERREKLGVGSEKSEEFKLNGQGFKY